MWSTYHTSYSNFFSQLMALRPLTCAQPVIPGLTSFLLRWVSLYRDRYSGSKGLGPMSDISPLRTLISCGISSSEVFLTKAPIFVKRSASGKSFPEESFLSFIVLNLMMLKIFPSFPGLL